MDLGYKSHQWMNFGQAPSLRSPSSRLQNDPRAPV